MAGRVVEDRLRDSGAHWCPAAAARTLGYLGDIAAAVRDAVVLVPFAALIDPLRVAFAGRGGWQPRIETVRTLAAALGPPTQAGPGQCSGDVALDVLQATQWLTAMRGLPLARRPSDRAQLATLVAEAAHALLQAAAQQPPARRSRWWREVMAALPPAGGEPGGVEAALLQAAAAWAFDAPAPASDRLFDHRPSAWIVVRLGGPDRLADAVLEASECGGLRLDLDPPVDDPYAPGPGQIEPRLCRAEDGEHEALAASAAVLQSLGAGAARVALVAPDRALVRRVSALLGRRGIELDDETGRKLSTTPAAGRVLARLRAMRPEAALDDRLDWLKRWPPAPAAALTALERHWRQGRDARLAADAQAAADALLQAAERCRRPWAARREATLADWLALLGRQLNDDGDARLLSVEPAGARLLQALDAPAASPAWRSALQALRTDLDGFIAWFEQLCESLAVERSPRPAAPVVVTPLARALGRPFDHVVLAGADARRLQPTSGPALVSDALAPRIGLEGREQRHSRLQLALAQLLRGRALTVLWRRVDDGAPLAMADAVGRLQARRAEPDRTLTVQAVTLPQRTWPASVQRRPRPVAARALPAALSASAIESLRQCPYRFFSRVVLRLAEHDELDQPARKRDYGDWLHAALHRFHAGRDPSVPDREQLDRAAEQSRQVLGLDASAMLDYEAGLPRVWAHYLEWLGAHEAAGWRWQAGEQETRAAPEAWAPRVLRGRVDRIDVRADGARVVIDYKTSALASLRDRVRRPLEDTQLAFYVALLEPGAPEAPIGAGYLALDDRSRVEFVDHAGVQLTARRFVAEVGRELARLQDGAPLPALGEGLVCDTCEARGLCRRDHWAQR